MKRIEVLIDETGNPTIQTSGFAGTECAAETAALEKALGAKTKDTKTADYYKRTANTIKQ